MANSPSHRLGQIIGDFLEDVALPLLEDFCYRHNQGESENTIYLDKKGSRSARQGQKLTWYDKYGNAHDLDFVIERGGTEDNIGHPIAFIEAAWRRYTKHSFGGYLYRLFLKLESLVFRDTTDALLV